MDFQSSMTWDPNGVLWLAQKWFTQLRVWRLSKCCVASRCNGLRLDIQSPDQEDYLQYWEQQIHHPSVWILSWKCNSERISWSGTQRTWKWWEILITVSETLRIKQYWQPLQPLTKIIKRLWLIFFMIQQDIPISQS